MSEVPVEIRWSECAWAIIDFRLQCVAAAAHSNELFHPRGVVLDRLVRQKRIGLRPKNGAESVTMEMRHERGAEETARPSQSSGSKAKGGKAARRRATRSGAARPSALIRSPAFEAGQWSRRPRLKGLPSTVAAQAGGGGETSCSSRNGSRPLLARSAKQGGGRAIFASQRPRRNRRRRATRSRRPDCPGRECVPPRRGYSGTVPTGRGSKGVAPQRGWHSSQRPHLRKVGHGSTRNFLANTRAPPSLRWARCGRTSTSVIVPRRAA